MKHLNSVLQTTGLQMLPDCCFILYLKTILDENLNPYDVDNANASAWGNGYKTIPKEIQAAVGKNEMLTKIITYFDSSVVPVLSDAIADEMYDAMKELVENCDLRASKK